MMTRRHREGASPGSWRRRDALLDVGTLLVVCGYICLKLGPANLFSETTTTGGDMASHYYGAWYLKNQLLPAGGITGWCQGSYGGFPFFQFYFPLPFLLMALLGYCMPLTISFKLVTVLSILAMPLAIYVALRLLRVRFPGPAIGATLSLLPLFGEAQSMWGGNILSVLAGEFNCQFGMALSLVFLASMYGHIRHGRYVTMNALLLALVGLSHGVGLVVSVFGCLFFFTTAEGLLRRAVYVGAVFLLSGVFMSVWLVPFLIGREWSTMSNDLWEVSAFTEVFPVTMWPWLVVAAVSVIVLLFAGGARRRELWGGRVLFVLFLCGLSLVLFEMAYELNVVNIRFLPYLGYLVVLLAALGCAALVRRLAAPQMALCVIVLFVLVTVDATTRKVGKWAEWNYSGFEAKPAWSQFKKLHQYLAGSEADPRVVYEHSPYFDRFGSIRALENLPYFSGRSTLEGLYIQSNISAPFVFYLQSEISAVSSTPLGQFDYTYPDLDRAVQHFRMFNVSQYVAVSDRMKEMARRHGGLTLEWSAGGMEVFRVKGDGGGYVEALAWKPVVMDMKNWRQAAHRWFQSPRAGKAPILFARKSERALGELSGLRSAQSGAELDVIEAEPYGGAAPAVESVVGRDRISINVSETNRPLLIKVSYHPGWRCKGGVGPFLVSPCQMVVFPTAREVTLEFRNNVMSRVGAVLGGLMLAVCVVGGRRGLGFEGWRWMQWDLSGARWRIGLRCVWGLVIALGVLVIINQRLAEPERWLRSARRAMSLGNLGSAMLYATKIVERAPDCAYVDDAMLIQGTALSRSGRFDEGIDVLTVLLKSYPRSIHVPEVLFRLGEASYALGRRGTAVAYWKSVNERFSHSAWSGYARDRLGGKGP